MLRWRFDTLVLILALLASLPAQAKVTVSVEGLDKELTAAVRAGLTLQTQSEREMSSRRIERLHELAEQEIETTLQAFGYYRPAIDARLERAPEGWHATYVVALGAPVRIEQLQIDIAGPGAEDPELTSRIGFLPLKLNDGLVHSRYEEAKRALLRAALDLGFLDAELVRHEVRVDLLRYRADIQMTLETGALYRFGEIEVVQDVLGSDLMDRLISIQPGDRLTTNSLIRQHQELRDSGYFSTVEILTLREQARDFAVPVKMRLSPRKPNRYSFGVGYGTDTGARASAGWERRRWDPRGHRSHVGLEISQVKNTASARYSIPLEKPLTDQLIFSTGYQDERTDTALSRKATVGTSRIFGRGDWLETLSLDYQWEDFAVSEQADISRLLIPGVSWTRTTADDPTYASKGSRFTVGLRAADQSLASTASFTQVYASVKLIHSFGRNSRVVLRGDAGQTNVDRITDLPASLRFFAGGDYSVRGYDYQSLGPKDENGEVIGGRRLLV
ncbi:MAG: hypothetical protein AMJ69_05995, partial [Gammaproteobacteria bacterium SG8_47]